MYRSPITLMQKKVNKFLKEQDDYILYQVNLYVDVDKEELIKALEYDRNQYEKGWNDCMKYIREKKRE